MKGNDLDSTAFVLFQGLMVCSCDLQQTSGASCIFTVCNSSCGKVMFSQASVILFTRWGSALMHAGIHPPEDTPWADTPQADTPWADTPRADTPPGRHPPGQTPPPNPPLHCSGRYASYWNAFL